MAKKLDLAGKTVLVVEDEAVIAMEMEEAVREAGGMVIGPAPSVGAAMLLIAEHPNIDAAILDVRLQDGVSIGVAQELRRKGVAVIFVTGYDDWCRPDDLLDVPIQRKPADAHDVVRLLSATT
jgi:DNA-binding NarL/FixJ family response regulator